MGKTLNYLVLIVILLFNFAKCLKAPSSKTFLVVGYKTASFQDKYTVALHSTGYDTPENLQIKLYGKIGSSVAFESIKNATLKKDGLERLVFDLKNQPSGNYFLRVTGTNFDETARLDLNTKKYSVLIQTDKAIYKPGDKVQFRILIINADTKPFTANKVEVYIKDANDNRIKQYENVSFTKGVYQQELQLSEEPVLGMWGVYIKVNDNPKEYVEKFEIAKYVLPKFEVSIITKPKISKYEDIVVSYKAKYTYGKEVEGTATVTAEVVSYWWDWYMTRTVQKTLDNSTKTTTIKLIDDLNLQYVYYTRDVKLTVTFKETLTGKEWTASTTVTVYETPYKIEVSGSDDVAKPDIPFSVKVYVKDVNDVPITDSKDPVNIKIAYTLDNIEGSGSSSPMPMDWWYWWWRPPQYQEITEMYTKFATNGFVELPITITKNVTRIGMEASYKGVYGYASTSVRPTLNNRFIKILSSNLSPRATQIVSMEIISNYKISSVNYVIIGRNNVVASRQLKSLPSKSFQFYFAPTIEMGPSPKIIAFYVTKDGEIISDQQTLSFSSDLKNFVNIELSQNETRPSSSLNISVKSKPQSYVGLLGVDQSVLLLKSGNDIDRSSVNNELNGYTNADVGNNDYTEPVIYKYYTDFSAANAVILTNAMSEYQRPAPPYYYYPEYMQSGSFEFSSMESSFAMSSAESSQSSAESLASQPSAPEQIPDTGMTLTRKTFPETWLFDSIDNIGGNTSLTKIVPDTITSWIITGFSLDTENGLGLTKEPTKLNVFIPFFISTNLPYSIKRGETIDIDVIIFNYMNDDYAATVTMFNDNQEFEFVESTASQQQIAKNISTKANSGTSLKFRIKALKVGYMTLKIEARTSIAGDRVENLLLVEAEGITKYINEAFLIDLRSQPNFNKQMNVVVPQDFIPDSLKIEASIIGDILGPTIENLDGLIRMPYGCGEQNMLNFVPNIIALDYLTAVNKLTPQIKATALNYMQVGYQRELTYKRYDGSYSAFGNYENFGSTWLTAFVAKSFRQASKYITIDQDVIIQALNFLEYIQAEDGSFPELGVVHNKALQGGSSGGAALTAYVLLTFLENQNNAASYKNVIDRAAGNIVHNTRGVDDVYVLSIAAYALYLAGWASDANSLLEALDRKASNSPGIRYWDKLSNDYYSTSLSVETSSYALLAYLEANRESEALLITKWLISKRNSYGGFSSTQDTVIGLLALAKISEKVISNSLNMNIDLKYLSDVKSFNVSQSNSLILQKLEFPPAARNINVSASGSGVVLGQISYHYNINSPKNTAQIVLSATVDEVIYLGFKMTVCVALNGLDQSNMAVIEISAPSGFIFDIENHNYIKSSSSTIKRVEFQKENTLLNIYFDYLQAEQQCIQVISSRAFGVFDQKPASVIVYDYYENDLRTEVFYTLN